MTITKESTKGLPAASTPAKKSHEKLIALGLGGGLIVVGVVIWQFLASAGFLNTFLTSSPILVVGSFVEQVASGSLFSSLAVTAQEFGTGFAISVVVGVTIGLVMGRYRNAEYAIDPYVWLLYSAPVVALYPLLVLAFGLGQPTVIFICFLMGVIPIIINTSQGVRNVDQDMIRTAVSFGAREFSILGKVVLPASVPTIMAGIRLGMGRSLVGVIVGEFFAGNAGIGYNVSYFAGHLDTTGVIAAVVIVVVIGVLLNSFAIWLEHRADSWRTEIA